MNIEELAFKDRRELANLNVIDLLDIIELLQKDRKQWIYQFTNTFNESIKINETALSLYKENQEFKKQLENTINSYNEEYNLRHIFDLKLDVLETKQKEFINYLEDLIKQNETVVEVSKYGLPENCSKLLIDFYKEILQKYKSIIGDINDKK